MKKDILLRLISLSMVIISISLLSAIYEETLNALGKLEVYKNNEPIFIFFIFLALATHFSWFVRYRQINLRKEIKNDIPFNFLLNLFYFIIMLLFGGLFFIYCLKEQGINTSVIMPFFLLIITHAVILRKKIVLF